MEAVNSKVHIRASSVDVDMNARREKQGPVMVEQTLRGWNMPISPIQYLPELKQIFIAASPSEGRGIFNKHYQPQAAAEKSKLTQQHHSFCLEADGTPQSYFGSSRCFVANSLFTVRFSATPTLIATQCGTFPPLSV